MKVNDLREKNVEELKKEIVELQRAYFNARMQKSTNALSNVASLKHTRRNVARAKTILTEKLKGAAK